MARTQRMSIGTKVTCCCLERVVPVWGSSLQCFHSPLPPPGTLDCAVYVSRGYRAVASGIYLLSASSVVDVAFGFCEEATFH
jgi:hypothetical protein